MVKTIEEDRDHTELHAQIPEKRKTTHTELMIIFLLLNILRAKMIIALFRWDE